MLLNVLENTVQENYIMSKSGASHHCSFMKLGQKC